jgi:hypothetical protein
MGVLKGGDILILNILNLYHVTSVITKKPDETDYSSRITDEPCKECIV